MKGKINFAYLNCNLITFGKRNVSKNISKNQYVHLLRLMHKHPRRKYARYYYCIRTVSARNDKILRSRSKKRKQTRYRWLRITNNCRHSHFDQSSVSPSKNPFFFTIRKLEGGDWFLLSHPTCSSPEREWSQKKGTKKHLRRWSEQSQRYFLEWNYTYVTHSTRHVDYIIDARPATDAIGRKADRRPSLWSLQSQFPFRFSRESFIYTSWKSLRFSSMKEFLNLREKYVCMRFGQKLFSISMDLIQQRLWEKLISWVRY